MSTPTSRHIRRALIRGAALIAPLLMAAACTTVIPASPLAINDTETTYVRVVSAPRPLGITMPPVTLGGAAWAIVGELKKSQSEQFADLAGRDRIAALEAHFQRLIIARAREHGLSLVGVGSSENPSLQPGEQLISLRSFGISYLATTMATSYRPMAMTIITSSRDPAIPAGSYRSARVASARVEDDRFSFGTIGSILDQHDLAMEGVDAAVDALANKIVHQLTTSRVQSSQAGAILK
jgi:hypothetical protein